MLMRLSTATGGLMIWLPLLLSLTWSVYAKEQIPKIKRQKFDTLPAVVKYFDDSDVILAQEVAGKLWRSDNGGVEWHEAKDVHQGDIQSVWMNPYHNEWAYALGTKGKHWVTKNKGESWDDFEVSDKKMPTQSRWPLSFHAWDAKKVIFKAEECSPLGCEESAYYTTDGFKKVGRLGKGTRECLWLAGTPQAKSPLEDKEDDSRILCIVQGDNFGFPEENRLVVSDNYFKDLKEPVTHQGRKMKGFINVAAVKGYMIAAAKAEGSTELSLMISTNGNDWHQAVFPSDHKIHEEAYTVMESTNYSVQVDVVTTKPWGPMGVLFSSDSNGTYFTKNIQHTNRNMQGIVDFEKVQGIQGIVMVNVVSNWEEVEKNSRAEKKLISQISFDDGRSWKEMKDDDNKRIHLHSVTEMSNTGKVFSSPAPGLLMGIGNTGDSLRKYGEGDLWVSDDAGLTWTRALKEAHKYEFGDQGTILVAIFDEGATDYIQYSLNHGKDWEKAELGDEKVRAGYLTTVPDSTSQKFVLQATGRKGNDPAFYLYSLDFTGIYSEKCKEDDFEHWHARLTDDGKPDCLMGHTQTYRRRKKDAKCYVGEKFREAIPETDNCKCSPEDYECDYNYIPELDSDGKIKVCKPDFALKAPSGECKDGKGTFKSPSGFRLIPGNTCKGGIKKDEEEVERPCEDTKEPVAPDGKIRVTTTKFRASVFEQKVYLERPDKPNGETDETIVMSVGKSSKAVAGIFVSRDHGKTWKQILEDDNYQLIVKHQYNNDRVFFISPNSKDVMYSPNRMQTLDSFRVEEPVNTKNIAPLSFHPDKPEYLIWTADHNCGARDKDCHNVAYISKDRGGKWNTLARYVNKCEFIERKARGQKNDLIYCEQKAEENPDGALQLRSTDDFGGRFETKIDDIIAFATMSEFIVVAQKDPESNLKLITSVDGQNFAHAKFPHDLNVPVQSAYTVLDSSTGAAFVHVTTSNIQSFEFGTIVKSNSNGTYYVTSLDYVNRNSEGYVDFEKMQGVEGVAMVNVVDNPQEANSGKVKKLRSMISHNDGGQWALLRAPLENPEGDMWKCDDPKECSLHLHSYTERDDAKDTFSSPSAVGLMLGVGNVGKYLGDINDKDDTYTFISRDAGISWKVAKKGRFMWEYGDQGSLIVIVERTATTFGYYSTDEGESWTRFVFAESKVSILDLTTTPSDNSKSFLLWFRNGDSEIGTINLDFTATRDGRICTVNEENHGNGDDYILWSPKHPLSNSDCLFGKKMQYLRKKPNANCWNGPKLERSHGEATVCECTRQDFECDYNYVRTADETCKLLDGLEPINHAGVCATDPDLKTWHEPKGYRKMKISQCSGGPEESKFLGQEHPCPGHENDPDVNIPARQGLSGFMFFLIAIVLPIAAAAAIGYLIWSRVQSGAGFGRIRLGDSGSASAFDADQPWVKYPIAVVSALVAVVAAVPLLLGTGWRALSSRFGGGNGRYTSRQSFARGRGDYSVVEDEDELLGDEEEEA